MIELFSLLILFLCVSFSPQVNKFGKERTVFLKAFLPLGVIIHHYFKGNELQFFTSDTQNLGQYVVSVFFFISGYGLTCKVKNEISAMSWKYVVQHIIKLFIPLLIVAIIYNMLNYFVDNVGFSINKAVNDLKIGTPPLPYTWFVMTYIWLLLMFKISLYFKHHYGGVLFLLLLSFIVMENKLFQGAIPFHHYSTIFAFYAGHVYTRWESYLVGVKNRKLLVVLSSVVLLMMAIASLYEIRLWGKQTFIFAFVFSCAFVYIINNINLLKFRK